MAEEDIPQVEVITDPKTQIPHSQPPSGMTLENKSAALSQEESMLRQAIVNSEVAGDLAAQAQANTPVAMKPESDLADQVPDKFKKPDGSVDVEKLQASTKQLAEGIEAKKEAVKSVEDYIREYKSKEKEFRGLPNAQKLQQEAPVEIPMGPRKGAQVTNAELRTQIQNDLNMDPVGTIIDLIRAVNEKENQPIKEFVEQTAQERRESQIKSNLRELVESDPRVLEQGVFAEINQELASNPELWKLKNPHRAAWLEVRDRLRLGEYQKTPAQPSRVSTPILGGGTPPPAPSVTGQPTARNIQDAVLSADPRNKDQMKNLEDTLRNAILRQS